MSNPPDPSQSRRHAAPERAAKNGKRVRAKAQRKNGEIGDVLGVEALECVVGEDGKGGGLPGRRKVVEMKSMQRGKGT